MGNKYRAIRLFVVEDEGMDLYTTDNITIEDLDAGIKQLQQKREQLVEGSKHNEYNEVK